MTWKTIGKRYERWMDVMIFLNTMGVYVYVVWFGADVTAMILLSGLNMACLTIARREELKRVLTPENLPERFQEIKIEADIDAIRGYLENHRNDDIDFPWAHEGQRSEYLSIR